MTETNDDTNPDWLLEYEVTISDIDNPAMQVRIELPVDGYVGSISLFNSCEDQMYLSLDDWKKIFDTLPAEVLKAVGLQRI